MTELKYIIKDPMGMHARPSAQLVKTASRFNSSITVRFGEKTADAKGLMSVMKLCAKQGDEIIFIIDGTDEAEAKKALLNCKL